MKKQKGFTLIELLIVIAIIGILAVAVLSVINPREQQRRAKEARLKADMQKIAAAAEAYSATCGTYAGSTGTADNCVPTSSSTGASLAACSGFWARKEIAIAKVPTNLKTPDNKDYTVNCSEADFCISGSANNNYFHYDDDEGNVATGKCP